MWLEARNSPYSVSVTAGSLPLRTGARIGRGPLAEGLIGGGKVICPMHGHQFCLETGAGSAGTESLQVFPVQEVDGTIQMTLESVLA